MSMAKQVCSYLIKKGEWKKSLCGSCRINQFKCEIRKERDDFEREETVLRFSAEASEDQAKREEREDGE